MTSKQEREEREEVYQNRIIYSLPVHLGLWNEELALRDEKTIIAAYKRDHCQLLIQKTRKMFRNVLKPTVLAIEAPYVLYGQNYQLKACDVTVSNTNKESSGLNLSGVINERDIDVVQHFIHGCSLSASPVGVPCVRNTFRVMGCKADDKDGQQVFYGQDVLLQISESSGRPLYLQCENSTIDTFGGHLSVRLSQSPDIYCRFKFLHWNPQKRYETIGTTFAPNTRVIIQHTASGRNLSVEPSHWIPSFYGPECMVSCHTYRDSHKMETAENFWKIITRPISDTALYLRAAKGEDIPLELFE
ncbi:cilia- and flagella-associated protein 161 [Leptinotarsa decemlineata]|uniref:cilia- and flagella-associated protein 161 n=1 Tax=Leptinotarsa decemlineata TaxID=7539 RepID=UPI000C254B59|nr:cilia- and flagella-associated protein 161 [Leptinotarsa decemlineata]